jgi:hypothetical protein
MPVRPPPCCPPWPGCCAGVGLICGVIGVVNGVVQTNPLMRHCGGLDGQIVATEMHGWHEIPTCVMHVHGRQEWNAVGHG